MTQDYSPVNARGSWRNSAVRPVAPRLSLRQTVPPGWHDDQPAFAGDPDMDWVSEPERPGQPAWKFTDRKSAAKPESRQHQ